MIYNQVSIKYSCSWQINNGIVVLHVVISTLIYFNMFTTKIIWSFMSSGLGTLNKFDGYRVC
jgi:hypothetical protein